MGGETASLYDTKQITERDEAVIIPVMISIIALLLLVYLRSIVAMIYLIVTVVLSFFSALEPDGYYFTSVWEHWPFKVQYRYTHLYF
ncbi:MMPL family transporter [Bacillus paranthracis]